MLSDTESLTMTQNKVIMNTLMAIYTPLPIYHPRTVLTTQ